MVTTKYWNMLLQAVSLMFVFDEASRAEDTFAVADVPLVTCIVNNPGVDSCFKINGNNPPPASVECADFPCFLGFCALPFDGRSVAAEWNTNREKIVEVPSDGMTQGSQAVTTLQPCMKHTVCDGCVRSDAGEFCGQSNPFVPGNNFTTGFLYAERLNPNLPCVKAAAPGPVI